MDREKHVDESWKNSVDSEKSGDKKEENCGHETCGCGHSHGEEGEAAQGFEVNFVNYVSSLAFQALIFLGEIPNPLDDSKIEKNLPQAKFLIDTLVMIREKTKNNLSPEEENIMNATVYELQMKFVELLRKEQA